MQGVGNLAQGSGHNIAAGLVAGARYKPKVVASCLGEQPGKQNVQGVRRKTKRDCAFGRIGGQQPGIDNVLQHPSRTALGQSRDPSDPAPLEFAPNECFLEQPRRFITALRVDDAVDTRVLVLPITHTPPEHERVAVALPPKVKQRLQLNKDRSWVGLSEWNQFVWPGPDLRQLPNSDDSFVAYDMLPPGLFATTLDRFLALVRRSLPPGLSTASAALA